MPNTTTLWDIEVASRRVAVLLGAAGARVQHGNWTGAKVATVVTIIWENDHRETLTLRGVKHEVYVQLLAMVKILEVVSLTAAFSDA